MKTKKMNGFISEYSLSNQIILDQQSLIRLAVQSDGEKLAEDLVVGTYDTSVSRSQCVYQRSERFLTKKLETLLRESKEARTAIEEFLRSPNLPDLEKPAMPRWMKYTQLILGTGMIVMTAVGTFAFVSLLEQSDESFSESIWKSLGYALSVNLVAVTGLKCFASLVPNARLQLATALSICTVGLSAAGFSIVGSSHLYAPKSKEAEATLLREALALDTFDTSGADLSADFIDFDPGNEADDIPGEPTGPVLAADEKQKKSAEPSFWKEKATEWIIVAQITAESCIAAVMGYFFGRNLKAYRSVSLRRTPEYKELNAKVEAADAASEAVSNELGEVEGHLESIASGRATFRAIGMGHFAAMKG